MTKHAPPVSHLLFVDDIFIFRHATLSNAYGILDALETFSTITGQSINCDKSGVFFNKKFHPRLKKYICNTTIKEHEHYLRELLCLS